MEALRHPGHLLLDISHHGLRHDPEVVGAVEADLGAIGEDDLGLLLGAVQEDDPHLALGDLSHVVIVCLGHNKLLLDDESIARRTFFPNLIKISLFVFSRFYLLFLYFYLLYKVLMAGYVTSDYSEFVPIVSEMKSFQIFLVFSVSEMKSF